jgi:methionine-rich copper-binding protein CopC
MARSRFRASAIGAGGLLAVVAGILAGPAVPALAHNSVIDESPKADSSVAAQPESVWIETSDTLLDAEGATSMDVLGPDGRHYATACPSVDGPVASVPAELGPGGEYTVEWRVVSADGHPITGEFAFTWDPADGEPVAEGADAAVCESGGGDSAGPGDAVDQPDAGVIDAAASGGVGDLLWVAAGGLVVVLAGLAAFLFTRRRPGAVGEPEPVAADEPKDPSDR